MASRTEYLRFRDFTHGSVGDWSTISAKCYRLCAAGAPSRIGHAAMGEVKIWPASHDRAATLQLKYRCSPACRHGPSRSIYQTQKCHNVWSRSQRWGCEPACSITSDLRMYIHPSVLADPIAKPQNAVRAPPIGRWTNRSFIFVTRNLTLLLALSEMASAQRDVRS
jgi:hypothetical protein